MHLFYIQELTSIQTRPTRGSMIEVLVDREVICYLHSNC